MPDLILHGFTPEEQIVAERIFDGSYAQRLQGTYENLYIVAEKVKDGVAFYWIRKSDDSVKDYPSGSLKHIEGS